MSDYETTQMAKVLGIHQIADKIFYDGSAQRMFDHTKDATEAIDWYKRLTIEQKIKLKELTELLCGISWFHLGQLFTPRERLVIIHNKLRREDLI